MTPEQELLLLRKEMRELRQKVASLSNAWEAQKRNNEALKLQNALLGAENKALKEENRRLKEKLEAATNTSAVLQGMIFKQSTRPKSASKRPRGAQAGHEAHNRKSPSNVDQEKQVYLSRCPECSAKLSQSNSSYSRIVEDIAPPKRYAVTRYHIERQWCPTCKKEVYATPKETVKDFTIGANAIMYVLYHKYRLRLPLAKIAESLKEHYDFEISVGNIQKILHSAKKWFGAEYEAILEKIQKTTLIHADETGWRIDGVNNWCWLFMSPDSVYYTIEETRGKGVPLAVLNENPHAVLVRDDYAAYSKLPIKQQSCWAHLLRKSHEESQRGSKEAFKLHEELKAMFQELTSIVSSPYIKEEREAAYGKYRQELKAITERCYTDKSAQAIQTRIANQNENLITALKHEGVPLTNNAAERQIRPMVVTRKISGGSRSLEGAATHAVNMSITQTLALQGRPFYDGIREMIGSSVTAALSDNGE
jgi:transposase